MGIKAPNDVYITEVRKPGVPNGTIKAVKYGSTYFLPYRTYNNSITIPYKSWTATSPSQSLTITMTSPTMANTIINLYVTWGGWGSTIGFQTRYNTSNFLEQIGTGGTIKIEINHTANSPTITLAVFHYQDEAYGWISASMSFAGSVAAVNIVSDEEVYEDLGSFQTMNIPTINNVVSSGTTFKVLGNNTGYPSCVTNLRLQTKYQLGTVSGVLFIAKASSPTSETDLAPGALSASMYVSSLPGDSGSNRVKIYARVAWKDGTIIRDDTYSAWTDITSTYAPSGGGGILD